MLPDHFPCFGCHTSRFLLYTAFFGLQMPDCKFGAGAGVSAKFTWAAHSASTYAGHPAFHAIFHLLDGWLHPRGVAGIWYDFGLELQAAIKPVHIQAAVGINKITGVI